MVDVGIGNGLIIFFFIFMTFSFVAFLINMIISCCGETFGNNADPNENIIAAGLNSRLNRETSHYRFRYDIPYDANDIRAMPNPVIDSDLELQACNFRYGYPLPSPPDHWNAAHPLSRAASSRSAHSSNFAALAPVEEIERVALPDSSNEDPAEKPPPSYDDIVESASSFI
ncbi:uncharacterized protein LOC119074530 [Bradysia coprophila]|uniref:uncharacterized protein LOC119074530 n=1 Tax=Bradysia coprophila TaxID=38358 RepID=UPI00187D70F7|nr:uncharacterized protein LOC119074530 [Bradysia coprophila]